MTDANPPRSRSGDRKRRIYLFVRDRILSGTPPTIREVQAHFGFRAVQSARDYLEALVRDGLLHPANPAFDPIVPDPAAVRILGKVIEVRRYLEGGALFVPEP